MLSLNALWDVDNDKGNFEYSFNWLLEDIDNIHLHWSSSLLFTLLNYDLRSGNIEL